jgi:hypothetical protein
VRLGPSTPGDYVRARVLVPRNPGVTPAVLRVDSPFSEDGGDGRPGYESIGIPEYGWGNPFVANVFGIIVLAHYLCDKKLGM